MQGLPGNPLNYKDDIDLVVFRENTEDLYSGVEFNPVPKELADVLGRFSKPFAAFKDIPVDQYAISAKVVTRKGSERIIRAAFDYARKYGRRKVTVIHKANVVRATEGYSSILPRKLPGSILRSRWMMPMLMLSACGWLKTRRTTM